MVTASANDPGCAARLEPGAVLQLVGGNNAGPWLGQGTLSVAGVWLDRDQIVTVVTVEDASVDHIVLRKPPLDLVAVGHAHTAQVDVGLDDVAVADVILVLQVLAYADDGHRHLVAQYHRIRLHVPVDARVVFAIADDFGVREAEAYRIVARQQFIGAVLWHRNLDQLAIAPQVLEAFAI